MTSNKTYIVNDQATEIDALDFTPRAADRNPRGHYPDGQYPVDHRRVGHKGKIKRVVDFMSATRFFYIHLSVTKISCRELLIVAVSCSTA